MTIQEIQNIHEKVNDLLNSQRLREALELLRRTAEQEPALSAYIPRVDSAEQTYFYMLRLLMSDTPFASAYSEFDKQKNSIRSLSEEMVRELQTNKDDSLYFAALRYQFRRPEESLEGLFVDYINENKRLNNDVMVLTDTRKRSRLEQLASDIFNRIWTLQHISDDEADMISSFIADKEIPAYDREIWVAAIGLSEIYDDSRIKLLAQAFHSDEPRIAAAALVWLHIICARTGDGNNPAYKLLADTLSEISQTHTPEVLATILELARQCNAMSRAEEINGEMMGSMRDISTNIAGNFSNFNGSPKDAVRHLNDTMSNISGDSFEKMKKMAEAQAKGEDILVSSLGRMKNFSFFRNVSNWFLPFHINHSALAEVVDTEGVGIADLLEKAPLVCDSDKYSLVLSLIGQPEAIRRQAIDVGCASLNALSERSDFEEIISESLKSKPLAMHVNNYVKNLYRFFEVFTYKNQFFNPFAKCSDIVDSYRLPLEAADDEMLEQFASLMMDYGQYDSAIEIYRFLANDLESPDYIYERNSGICYQRLGMTAAAIACFTTALQVKPDDLESAMTLAELLLDDDYMEDENLTPVSVLEPFAESQISNPDFLNLMAAAYIAADNFNSAVETYYNLDFILPDGDLSARPKLAEALLFAGDAVTAFDTLKPAIPAKPDFNMMMLQIVILWMLGRRTDVWTLLGKMTASGEKTADHDPSKIIQNVTDRIKDHYYPLSSRPEGSSLLLIPEMLRYKFFGGRFGSL